MNQILDIESGKRNKAPKNSTTDFNKMIKIFGALLIIFAVLLIGSGIYSLIKNNLTEEEEEVDLIAVRADINAVMDEANVTVILTVESEVEINKVIYNWNTNTEMTIDGENQTIFEESIALPSGKNTLNVKVIDVDGNETSESFEFESEVGTDINNPDITLEVTEENNLLITATDETELLYLTYKWNDEETVTVEVEDDADDKTVLTVEIEIPKDTNTIMVTAIDASYNTTTETQTLVGVLKPEITYELSEDGVLTFYCSHEDGIKEVYYTLNGEAYGVTYTDETGYYSELSFDVILSEGYNEIELTVTSTKDSVKTFTGECTIGDTTEETTTEETENAENVTE